MDKSPTSPPCEAMRNRLPSTMNLTYLAQRIREFRKKRMLIMKQD
jgi:hypothetical protein